MGVNYDKSLIPCVPLFSQWRPLSTYFLNDWPAHMLNKHKSSSVSTSGDQCSMVPFVVRQLCYLCGKKFITFIKLEEVVQREELSL